MESDSEDVQILFKDVRKKDISPKNNNKPEDKDNGKKEMTKRKTESEEKKKKKKKNVLKKIMEDLNHSSDFEDPNKEPDTRIHYPSVKPKKSQKKK